MNRKNHYLLSLCFLVFTIAIFSSCTPQKSYERTPTGITIKTEGQTTEIHVYADNIIRIFRPSDSLVEKQSLVVNMPLKPIEFITKEYDLNVVLKTEKLQVIYQKKTGLVKFFKRNKKPLLIEKEWEIKNIVVDGLDFSTAQQTFKLDNEEAIYGLGQRQEGHMNHRGKKLTLVQTNTTAVVPFLISTRNYGILWDNYSKTIFEDNENGCTFWSEIGDGVDYYFVAGENMDEVIAGYRDLSGHAPMFGKWAYGYWQCKERYRDGEELMGIVKEFRDRKIPIDNIVQDWCYWADYIPNDEQKTWLSAKDNWSSLVYDPSTYADPVKTLKELHDKYHMHYMISIWPALGPKTAVYKEMKKNGFLHPPEHWSSGYLYDPYSEAARNIYWKHIKNGLIAKGVDALWMDGTEPEVMNQHTFDTSYFYIKKLGETAMGHTAKYLNTYSLMTTEGVYQNFRKDFPDKRVFILTRSGFAGQQRNAALTWSGDINARFDIMRDQVSSGLNYCMAGIPYWTHDIGAFFVEGHDYGDGPAEYPDGVKDEAYKELYVRWFQFGAFTPIFRSHGTHTPREPWQFGEPGDWAYDAILKFDNLRYRLMPYIYSLAWKVTDQGYTIMRGLPMDFSYDKNVLEIDNQFMFGSALLVTPVSEHQHFPPGGITTREVKTFPVYLPDGTYWFNFWTGDKIEGGQQIRVATPISEMPLFVKAGSIVPMGPFKEWTTEKPEDPIELRIYPGADGEFVLYEDENDNYNYEDGIYATIPIIWDETSQILTIGERKGSFPGMLQERTFNIIWVEIGKGVGVETCIAQKTINYKGTEVQVSK